MFDRIMTLIVAVGLGFLVWVYIRSRDQDYYERELPLVVSVAPSQAEHFTLEQTEPYAIPVVFSGPPSRIREVQTLFRQGALKLHHAIVLPEDKVKDVREATVNTVIRLDAATLPVPNGVRADIPEMKKSLNVGLRRIVEVKLPVRLNLLGTGQTDRVVFEPATVMVRGPKEILDRQTSIATEPFAPPPLEPDKAELQLPATTLRLPGKLGEQLVTVTPSQVQATITLKGPQKLQELTEVPVQFLAPPRFPYRPRFTSDRADTLTLKIRGPNSELRPEVTAYIDLTQRKFGPGLHADEPIQIRLPPGYTLVSQSVARLSIQLDPVETGPESNLEKRLPPP